MDFSNYSFASSPNFIGKTVRDRLCLKAVRQQTCLALTPNEIHPEFLYVKNFINPNNPDAKWRSTGILGFSPSDRTNINSYLQYLKSQKLIDVHGFTLNQNLIGSRSRLYLGLFNESLHQLNFT